MSRRRGAPVIPPSGGWIQAGPGAHGVPGKRNNPALQLVIGFAALIGVGTLVLALPWSSATGRSVGIIDAFFTATSAVCVTGLTVLDTATAYSGLGQATILALVQLGGLGITIAYSLVMLVLGRRILLKDRLVLQEAMGRATPAGVVRLTKEIVAVALIIETVGALLLLVRLAGQYPFGEALWLSVFHSVNAFNNAGFDLFSTSLKGHTTDILVILTMASLIILGGIGFAVINEFLQPLYRWWRDRRQPAPERDETYSDVPVFGRRWRLSLHSRVVLASSLILWAGGTAIYGLMEWNNPDTFGPLHPGSKLLASFFSAVTPRTAGFEVVPTARFHPATLLITILLMFIGASPGGTGGGIKTTTWTAMVLSVKSAVRGDSDLRIFNRRLPHELIARAWVIAAMAGGMCFLVTTIMMITERGQQPMAIFFEVVSAFATVGLSTGITSDLTDIGKLLITLMMFMGRVGPLTLAVALAERRERGMVDYPEERVMIG